MSPIESTSSATLVRGALNNTQSAFSARSGADRAQTLQAITTSAAAAPVETARAVAHAQAAASSRMKTEPRPSSESIVAQAAKAAAATPNPAYAKPMTAVLLQELRLQQELAHVQEQKQEKPA